MDHSNNHKINEAKKYASGAPLSNNKKEKRENIAKNIVEQARFRDARQGSIEELPSTRLERLVLNNCETLKATFPQKGGAKPHEIDLTFLLKFPGLCDKFTQGFMKWGSNVAPNSRENIIGDLRRNWFKFLTEKNLSLITLDKIDEQIMAGFNQWLHRRTLKNGNPLNPNTIKTALCNLKIVLQSAPGGRELGEMVPRGPRLAHLKSNPTKVLTIDELMAVVAAIEKEVLALQERWDTGRKLLEQGKQFISEGKVLEPTPKKSNSASCSVENLALTLAIVDQRYPANLPDQDIITNDDPLLGATIQHAFGSGTISNYLYANGRDLVPLVLSIAVATAFNPDTVLALEWKNIDRKVDRLSNGRNSVQIKAIESEEAENAEFEEFQDKCSPLVKLTGNKPRASRQLVRLLDPDASGPGQVNLNLVLDLIFEMTARIRPNVIDEFYTDRIFLFVQTVCSKLPKGYGSSLKGPSSDRVWYNSLQRFVLDNNLSPLSLKSLRATMLDYVQLFNQGDLEAAREIGNHKNRITTWTHYTSDLVKRLLQEAVGESMIVRGRWLDTKGSIDPRKFREWTDKGCATPGWACLDPFDSPRPNQRNGRLCTAYGECPDCPLAAARIGNPRNVMLYEALRRAIYRSILRVTSVVWQQRWAPVLAALDQLLALIPSNVLDESRKLTVDLPDVG
ncbi:phage integrase SAM-like domain-containing protein [Chitinimonas sp. JJ19]|uniref:phage integrase SAM-like domain-containing protein n=1 Tax=Chitinimonas sp. JJ19 TaxID=3109352 RepID=UPI003002D2E9